MKSKSDEELIELIVQNHRPALEELYDRYVKLIYSFSIKITKGDTEKRKKLFSRCSFGFGRQKAPIMHPKDSL